MTSSNANLSMSESQQSIPVCIPSFLIFRSAQVSFTEKAQQCQKFLADQYPDSCIFKDASGVMSKDGSGSASAFQSSGPCARHKGKCQFPVSQDISIFGAPCVDDSLIGALKKDKGEARRVS